MRYAALLLALTMHCALGDLAEESCEVISSVNDKHENMMECPVDDKSRDQFDMSTVKFCTLCNNSWIGYQQLVYENDGSSCSHCTDATAVEPYCFEYKKCTNCNVLRIISDNFFDLIFITIMLLFMVCCFPGKLWCHCDRVYCSKRKCWRNLVKHTVFKWSDE